jgi:peptide-methionine (S)-S-oxide reductase
VGYAGGTSGNPTYRNLGGHTETIQIVYNPSVITYRELLAVFWDSHTPVTPPYSQQYKSIIFYHDAEQERLARETLEEESARLGAPVYTEILPFAAFYPAEDYHQKYYLQREGKLFREMEAIYPDMADLIVSTAAARLNGYAGGWGTEEALERDLDSYGLSEDGKNRLLDIAGRGITPACPLPQASR